MAVINQVPAACRVIKEYMGDGYRLEDSLQIGVAFLDDRMDR